MTREHYLSEPAMVVLIIINSIISILAICGNAFVVGAFFVSPKVRTRSNFFLCSLAAADLLAGIVCIPMWNFVLYTESTEGVRDTKVYDAYQSSLDPLFGVASIMNLLAVSLVRLWMVKRPLQFDGIEKTNFAIAAFVFPWGMGLIAVIYLRDDVDPSFRIMLLVCVVYFIPLLVIILCYSVIICIGLRHMNPNTESYKYASMLVIVVVCFIVTWAPFFCTMIVNDVCPHCSFLTFLSVGIVKTLQYSNTVMNPLIYSFRSEDFRDAFKKILLKTGLCSSLPALQVHSQEEIGLSQTCVVPAPPREEAATKAST